MKTISPEIHQILILLAKRVNPSYPNWWYPKDQYSEWLETGVIRCLICNKINVYEKMVEHAYFHLKEYGLLAFI